MRRVPYLWVSHQQKVPGKQYWVIFWAGLESKFKHIRGICIENILLCFYQHQAVLIIQSSLMLNKVTQLNITKSTTNIVTIGIIQTIHKITPYFAFHVRFNHKLKTIIYSSQINSFKKYTKINLTKSRKDKKFYLLEKIKWQSDGR